MKLFVPVQDTSRFDLEISRPAFALHETAELLGIRHVTLALKDQKSPNNR
jgi:hypothetical protein